MKFLDREKKGDKDTKIRDNRDASQDTRRKRIRTLKMTLLAKAFFAHSGVTPEGGIKFRRFEKRERGATRSRRHEFSAWRRYK